ncbi:MAG: hypothetical protein HZA48_13170 [Planctomycetes bacterium]|nr:hypothetical protein [Planctomycetota bacterium]
MKALFYLAVFIVFVKEIIVPIVFVIAVPRLVPKLINGSISVGWARVTITGELVLKDIVVRTREGNATAFFKADRLGLDVNFLSLAKGEFVFSNLLIDKGRFILECGADGKWNFTEFFEHGPGTSAVPHIKFGDFPLEQVRLKESDVVFRKINADGAATEISAVNLCGTLRKEGGTIFLQDMLEGECAGGKLTVTDVRITPGDRTSVYFQINADKSRIEELIKTTPLRGRELSGSLTAFLTITRNEETGFIPAGSGYFDICDAKIWSLPFFLSILNVLDFALPGSAAVDEARMKYNISNGSFEITEMAFLSHAISLIGEGSMDLNGKNLDMVFVHRFGKEGFGQLPIFGGAVQGLLDFVQGNINQIEVSGTFSEPQVHLVPLKIITKPVMTIHDLFSGD